MKKSKLTKRTLKYMGVKSNPNVDAMVTALEKFIEAGELLKTAHKEFEDAYYLLGKGKDGKLTSELFVSNAGTKENADKINDFKRVFWDWWQGQYGNGWYSKAKDLLGSLKQV